MRARTAALVLAAVATSVLAASSADAGPIARRARMQQQRIARGIASGTLTPREAGRLERREARLAREVAALRRANGGSLTPGERRLVDRRQDRLSRAIFREKHDRRRGF